MTSAREILAILGRKIVVLGLLGGFVAILPYSAEAQLRPWNSSNEVLVDLSVLGQGGGSPASRTAPGVLLPSLSTTVLDPPLRSPVSRLLVPRPPVGNHVAASNLPRVKLIPPSQFKKRRASSRPRSHLTRRQPKAPVRHASASKPTKKLKPTEQKPMPKPEPKPALAPAPPAQPKTPVKVAKAPPPPAAIAPPPPPPNIASAQPAQKKPSAPSADAQTASRGPAASALTSNVTFASGASGLTEAIQKQLNSVADRLKKSPEARMQLLAYAGEPNMSSSKARRLSLSRALAVRSYLINKGVRSTRIDVRALGNKVPGGSPSRVDLRVIGK